MEQRVSLITLGVSDLARARGFYEALGWRAAPSEAEDVVFFQAGCMVVALWDRAALAADSGVPDPDGFGGVALAHNVRSAREVDDVIAAAAQAGARITRPAAGTFYGGYAGVFVDPDGHAWEVAWNPGFALSDDGALTLPDFSVR